jgi:hypothetical protein
LEEGLMAGSALAVIRRFLEQAAETMRTALEGTSPQTR